MKINKEKSIQFIFDPSGSGLKSNVNITPDDCIAEGRDIANQLKIPDNIKKNMDKIIKSINQKINNFDNGNNDDNNDYGYDDDNDDDNDDEIEDI